MTGFDDCDGVADLLPEFLAGRVSEQDDKRIRTHLQVCSECRNRANAVSLLQQTPVPSPDPDRWNYFVKGVVQETERRQRTFTRRGALIVAAVILALATLLLSILLA